MDERTGDRWLSTAMVRHLSKPLPSVDLIQIGEVYVVVDGHKKNLSSPGVWGAGN